MEIEEYIASDEKIDGSAFYKKRNKLLKGVKRDVIRTAWFNLAHLILDDGAKVLDIGCGDGEMTYTLACLNPEVHFTGISQNRRDINKAKEKYRRPNLEFTVGKLEEANAPANTYNAIICSYVLHQIYSGSRYNDRMINSTLENYFRMLKKGGALFLRDYASPPDNFVLLEFLHTKGEKGSVEKMSEPDLLERYSEQARPKQDQLCRGFFLEELPPRYPHTRLFRLPYKWAYEFIMRKDKRDRWETELPIEYTFNTLGDIRKELTALGARIQYSGPHWEERIIDKSFKNSFRLYKDDRTPLGSPPTCFVAVAFKMPERKSLHIEERRPADAEESKLAITAMRDTKTGKIYDIVNCDTNLHEIIPYRITEEGRLKVYLHDGIARSITNSVPRSGYNFDGRQWSGHMIEPVAVDDSSLFGAMEKFDIKHTALFAREYLGLKPAPSAVLEVGPDYYPAPDHIDEHVQTYYLSVNKANGEITPKSFISYESHFQAKGVLREVDAQQILNAIDVGLIPNARLELQILTLFNKLKLMSEISPDRREFPFKITEINKKGAPSAILKQLNTPSKRYQDIKGNAGQIRVMHSTFVEEGFARGSTAGLSAEDMDFFVHDGKTINTAVIIPLSKDKEQEVHASFLLEHLPVPQRHTGKPGMMVAPSFNLPPHITSQEMAKQYIGERFGVTPDLVIKLGESYFSHIGLTPQRIHPYAVLTPGGTDDGPDRYLIPFRQIRALSKLIKKDAHFMKALFKAYKYLHEDHVRQIRQDSKAVAKYERGKSRLPEWDLPTSFAPAIFTEDDEDGELEHKLESDPARMYKTPEAMAKFDAVDGFNTIQKIPESNVDITKDVAKDDYDQDEIEFLQAIEELQMQEGNTEDNHEIRNIAPIDITSDLDKSLNNDHDEETENTLEDIPKQNIERETKDGVITASKKESVEENIENNLEEEHQEPLKNPLLEQSPSQTSQKKTEDEGSEEDGSDIIFLEDNEEKQKEQQKNKNLKKQKLTLAEDDPEEVPYIDSEKKAEKTPVQKKENLKQTIQKEVEKKKALENNQDEENSNRAPNAKKEQNQNETEKTDQKKISPEISEKLKEKENDKAKGESFFALQKEEDRKEKEKEEDRLRKEKFREKQQEELTALILPIETLFAGIDDKITISSPEPLETTETKNSLLGIFGQQDDSPNEEAKEEEKKPDKEKNQETEEDSKDKNENKDKEKKDSNEKEDKDSKDKDKDKDKDKKDNEKDKDKSSKDKDKDKDSKDKDKDKDKNREKNKNKNKKTQKDKKTKDKFGRKSKGTSDKGPEDKEEWEDKEDPEEDFEDKPSPERW